ncbi:MAG: flippase-like domain-containing protein [Magnetococcales bacterium]|nr:flippase-like domain-containing protein [Magnetococcales bacterium]
MTAPEKEGVSWGGETRWRLVILGAVVLGLAVAGLKMAELWGGFHLEILYPWILIPILVAHAGALWISRILWQNSLLLVTSWRLENRQAFVQVGMLLVAKYVPGKVWGLLSRGLHARQFGISTTQATTASVLEQMAFLLSSLLAIVLGLFHDRPSWAGMGVFGAVVMMVSCPLAVRYLGLTPRLRGAWREGLCHLCSSAFLGLCLLSLGIWILASAVLFCVLFGIGADISTSLALTTLAAVPAAMLSGLFFFFVPGGIGIREGVLVFFLQPVVGLQAAIMASMLFRILDTVRDVAIGLWTMNQLRQG